MNVEPQVLEKRIQAGYAPGIFGLGKEDCKIKVRVHAETRDCDVAGKQGTFGGAGITQRCVGGSADSGRIPQAHVLASGREIEVETAAIGEEAAQIEYAASAVCREFFNLQTVLRQHHGSVDVAQTVWQIRQGGIGLLQLDASCQKRMRHGAGSV